MRCTYRSEQPFFATNITCALHLNTNQVPIGMHPLNSIQMLDYMKSRVSGGNICRKLSPPASIAALAVVILNTTNSLKKAITIDVTTAFVFNLLIRSFAHSLIKSTSPVASCGISQSQGKQITFGMLIITILPFYYLTLLHRNDVCLEKGRGGKEQGAASLPLLFSPHFL